MIKTRKSPLGFTVVELLVIVVAVGILAGIVIVAYNGMTASAVETSMKSDLQNAATHLEGERRQNNGYPANGSALVNSEGNSFGYEVKSYGYCLAVTNPKIDKTFRVKSDNPQKIEEGGCAVMVTTLAGADSGFAEGTGTAARFSSPRGVAVDSAGNVYVGDYNNHRIRKVSPAGVVTTYAGSTYGYADGTGAAAQFYRPYGVAVDSAGNVYVADQDNHRIRKISSTGVVTTLAGSTAGYADGTGAAARFNSPQGVAVDSAGNVYVADYNNHCIRKISPAGVVTTLAGPSSYSYGYVDGTGTAARFNLPSGVAVDSSGNVYVADQGNQRIRKVSPSGVVTTLAGSTVGYVDGTGAAAQFSYPYAVAVDSAGTVYVADRYNHRIREISSTGVVTTLAGSTAGYADGPSATAQFMNPYGVTVDSTGTVYVADTTNHRIRKIEQ